MFGLGIKSCVLALALLASGCSLPEFVRSGDNGENPDLIADPSHMGGGTEIGNPNNPTDDPDRGGGTEIGNPFKPDQAGGTEMGNPFIFSNLASINLAGGTEFGNPIIASGNDALFKELISRNQYDALRKRFDDGASVVVLVTSGLTPAEGSSALFRLKGAGILIDENRSKGSGVLIDESTSKSNSDNILIDESSKIALTPGALGVDLASLAGGNTAVAFTAQLANSSARPGSFKGLELSFDPEIAVTTSKGTQKLQLGATSARILGQFSLDDGSRTVIVVQLFDASSNAMFGAVPKIIEPNFGFKAFAKMSDAETTITYSANKPKPAPSTDTSTTPTPTTNECTGNCQACEDSGGTWSGTSCGECPQGAVVKDGRCQDPRDAAAYCSVFRTANHPECARCLRECGPGATWSDDNGAYCIDVDGGHVKSWDQCKPCPASGKCT